MIINGFEVDFTDYEFIEKLEKEYKKLKETADNLMIDEEHLKSSVSNQLKAQFEMCRDFIDGVFGEGADEKIYKNSKSITKRLSFIEEIIEYKEKEQEKYNQKFSKYSKDRLKR